MATPLQKKNQLLQWRPHCNKKESVIAMELPFTTNQMEFKWRSQFPIQNRNGGRTDIRPQFAPVNPAYTLYATILPAKTPPPWTPLYRTM